MLARLRARLTYANVVATLALFLALGGVSYAAIRVGSPGIVNNSVRTQDLRNNDIRSKDIRNRTITNADILTNTVTGQQVRESSLSKVPDADTLDGADSASFRQRCPADTQKALGVCIDTNSRARTTWPAAREACSNVGGRLPTWFELDYVRTTAGYGWADGNPAQYEFTSDVETINTRRVVTVDKGGADLGAGGADPTAQHFYRCVIYPSDS